MPGRAFAPLQGLASDLRAYRGLNPVMPGRAFAPSRPDWLVSIVALGSQSRDARESVRALKAGDKVRVAHAVSQSRDARESVRAHLWGDAYSARRAAEVSIP